MKRTGITGVGLTVCFVISAAAVSPLGGFLLAAVEDLAPAIVNVDRYVGPVISAEIVAMGR